MGMRLLPPLELETGRPSPQRQVGQLPGRHYVPLVISALLCSSLLLAGLVAVMDVDALNTSALAAKVPDIITEIGSSHRTTAARFDFSLAAGDTAAVDERFGSFYASHAGASYLAAQGGHVSAAIFDGPIIAITSITRPNSSTWPVR